MGNMYSKRRGFRNATFAPEPLRTAALRIRCANKGISCRRFEPITSTPSRRSMSAIFRPRPGKAGSPSWARKSSCRRRWSMLAQPTLRAICASRYSSSTVAMGEARNPAADPPCAAATFCRPSAAAASATSQSTARSSPSTRTMGCETRSAEYMPSNPKRSRSAIQVSLSSSFSRGTMRISLPRSTCAYRLVPKASCGDTSGCCVISQARAW